mgnify:CR=1 FL=1
MVVGALLDISPTLFAVPVFLFFVWILEVLQLALALICCFCDTLFIVLGSVGSNSDGVCAVELNCSAPFCMP